MFRLFTSTRRLALILAWFVFPLGAHAEIIQKASDYGLSSENSPGLNRLALQNAIDAHKAGSLDVLEIDSGVHDIDGVVDISGWNGLEIVGEPGAVINTLVDQSIFRAVLNDQGVRNGVIRNLTLSSSYSGTANFYENPSLFFIGGVDFHNFLFENVEFTAPEASVNGSFVANESITTTRNITFRNCHFHHLGGMGAEFINHYDPTVTRFFDITFEQNRFSNLGYVPHKLNNALNGIAISLSGTGDGALITNNVFGDEIGVIDIENTGLDNIVIRDNQHQGNKGSMYQFTNVGVVSNVLIENETGGDQYENSYFWNVENVRINNVTSSGHWVVRDAKDIFIRNLSISGSSFGVFGLSGLVDGFQIENSQITQLDSDMPVFVFNSETHNDVVVRDSCLEQENQFHTISSTGGATNIEFVNISYTCDNQTDTEAPAKAQLSVSQVGDEFVSLQWTEATDNVGISHYRVYQDGAFVEQLSASERSYTAMGLSNGREVVFMVRAFDEAGNQSSSNDVSAMPSGPVEDNELPSAPALSATRVGDGFVTLNWTAATDNVGISHYVLYQSGAHGIRFDANQRSYTARGLPNEVREVFMVRAFDFSGNQRNSNDIWVTPTAQAEDREPPTSPTLSATRVGDGFVTLNWTAATDNVGISHYVLYQDGAHGIRFDANQRGYTARGLPNEEQEVFMVRAFDTSGNQRNSNDLWVTPGE